MITRKEAIAMLESDDLTMIALEADAVRKKWHPERIVTYCAEAGANTADRTIATIRFGPDDSIERQVSRLETVRRIQEDTGSLVAVHPWFAGTAVEYLRTLGVCRIYLDNIPNVQTSAIRARSKVFQIALRFGANDLSAASGEIAEEEIRRVIRDAGFVPKERDALFRTYYLD